MFAQFAGLAAVACYVFACTFLWHCLAKKQVPNKLLILSLGFLALPLHGIHLQQQIYHAHGLDLGLFNILRWSVGSLLAYILLFVVIGHYWPPV